MEISIEQVMEVAKNAGWIKGITRNGRTYYQTPAGKREWIDVQDDTMSVGVWLLWHNRPK